MILDKTQSKSKVKSQKQKVIQDTGMFKYLTKISPGSEKLKNYCSSILSAIALTCLPVMAPSINFLKPLPGCTITVAGIEPSHELSILGINTLGSVSDNQA